MFSGVKSKFRQWKQPKKKPTEILDHPSNETIRQIAERNRDQLQNLFSEYRAIIQQLKDQVSALNSINEDTTAVSEKITSLEATQKAIENGLITSEEFMRNLEFISLLDDEINKCSREMKDLHHQASSLVKENKVLRKELSSAQDNILLLESKSVELDVQVEHLKFMNSLPDWEPFWEERKSEDLESKDKNSIDNSKEILPLLYEDDSIDYAGPHILSLLDSVNVPDKKLKIFLDLIKSYVQKQAFEVALPLLKNTLEELKEEYHSHDNIIFPMLEATAIGYSVTKRFKAAIEVQTEIEKKRKELMPGDEKGLAKTMSSLAVLNGKEGNSEIAISFCEDALDLKKKVYGESDSKVAKELHNLGVLYFYDGLHSKAIDCLVSAKKKFESSPETDVPSLARCSLNLATVKVEIGQVQEAKKILQRILETLNSRSEKLLSGASLSKEDILNDKTEGISDSGDLLEVKRVVPLATEVEEKMNSLSQINQDRR